MGWNFRKRIKLLPGIHLNVSKSGLSVTVGTRGFNINFGKKGQQLNVGIPGSGIYYRKKLSSKEENE